MRLRLRLFAVFRERLAADEVEIEFQSDSVSIAELKAALIQRDPQLEPLLKITRIAVNQQFATENTLLGPQDVVALIPPVSGGRPEGLYKIRETPVDLAEVEDAVRRMGAGATVTFTGTVRNRTGEHAVEFLEYEAYVEMAEGFLAKIGAEIQERWPGACSAILHREGRVLVGEVSVVIAVSHPHRAQAFDACRHAIEALKKDVPIWKKEYRTDGSIWVGVGS